jgi:hypothetical protein
MLMFLTNVLLPSSKKKHGSLETGLVIYITFKMVVMGPKESKDRSPV